MKVMGRLRPRDIDNVISFIRKFSKVNHRVNSEILRDDYVRAFEQTRATTMTATGELKSKLFFNLRRGPVESRFIYGYGSTKNNQAVAQEFTVEGTGVRVHRTEAAHFREDGVAKCSRTPEDLYVTHGRRYLSNPKARRRAMATAIQRIFKTSVNSSVVKQSGGNIHYVPNFRKYAQKLSRFTRTFLQTLGITQ